jgi:hypothetical protein
MEIHQAIYQKLKTTAATKKHVVFYSEIAPLADLNMDLARDRAKLGNILGNISIYENNNNRPMLSVVAVEKRTHQPSYGFYNLAKELGLYNDHQDQDAFFIDQLNKAYDFWHKNIVLINK